MPMPRFANRLYQPRTRAESAAPLEAVAAACESDPSYRHAVAVILADCLKPADAAPEPVPGEDPAARLLRQVARGGVAA